MEWSTENMEEKKKTGRKNYWKGKRKKKKKEYKESQMTIIYIFGFKW